jgi:hypothetical protein
MMAKLEGLDSSKDIQQGDFLSDNTGKILKDRYKQLSELTPIDMLFILDKNGIAKINVISNGNQSYVGVDFSSRDWIRESKDTLSPMFSDTYIGLDGKLKIGLAYPIVVNSAKEEYVGSIGIVVPAGEFFRHFGNIYDLKSSYLSVLDSMKVQIVHPLPELVGKPFFSIESQEITGRNEALNNHLRKVSTEGKPSIEIYKFQNDERLNTGYPILFG